MLAFSGRREDDPMNATNVLVAFCSLLVIGAVIGFVVFAVVY
jgi:hypothetical protein